MPLMSNHGKYPKEHVLLAQSETSVQSVAPLGILAGVALIAVTAVLVYLPSLSGDFLMDDNAFVSDNQIVKASDGLYRFWCTTEPYDYWPVSNITFWIEWRLWGKHTTGYHVTNLVLHIVEALLIWVILRKLSVPGAFLAAMIFATHPVNVESVAWIAQRKNMVSMLFFLLSILCFLKIKVSSSSFRKGLYRIVSPLVLRFSSPWYLLSLAAFALAMLSKGSVAVLPAMLLMIVWWLRPLTRRDMVWAAPFFAVAIIFTGVNVWFQTHGADIVVRNAGFSERLLGAGGVVWFYLYKALLPFNLAFIYPQWIIQADNPLWWLPLLAAVSVTGCFGGIEEVGVGRCCLPGDYSVCRSCR